MFFKCAKDNNLDADALIPGNLLQVIENVYNNLCSADHSTSLRYSK